MSLQVREIEAQSILTPQKWGSLSGGYDYSINPYAGCAFSCSYCYVPKFPNKDHLPAEWGNWVNVKLNAPELIRKDRLKVFGAKIFFSSATDPYQYLEMKYRLSRRCLQELQRYQPAKLTLHTRSHLVLQDLELLKSFGNRLRVGVSITTDNDAIRAEFEPKAPSIKRRLELIRELKANDIKVHASLAPLLPCNPDNLIELISPHVEKIWIDQMNWPEINNRPWLLDKYADFFAANNYSKIIAEIKKQF